MQAAAAAGRLKEVAVAGERLGRLKQQNWRAAHAFNVTIKKLPQPRGRQHLEIIWQASAKFGNWSQLADGCYLLRSNLKRQRGTSHISPQRQRRSPQIGNWAEKFPRSRCR